MYCLQFFIDYQINKEISLPCPEEVGEVCEIDRTSLKSCVCVLLIVQLFFTVGSTSILHLGLRVPLSGCWSAHNKWYQSIPGSAWDHLLIQGHQLLFGRDRVSISERRWDCLWDRVSISKQRVDCSRNQFEGVDSFENSSRVSRGAKDLIFI